MKLYRFAMLGALVALAFVTVTDAYAMGEIVHAVSAAPALAPAAFAGLAALHAARPRAILSLRADGNDPVSVLASLKKAFEDFKAENDTKLKAKADVVIDEKVERINSSMTELQSTLDDLTKKVAAAAITGGDPQVSAEVKAYRKQFNAFFRQGENESEVKAYNVQAAARTGSNPDGGYLVTDEMEGTIGRILGSVSSMRQLATVRTIGTATYKKAHGLGGAGSGWVGETADRTETSTPQLAELSFPTMELYAMPAATQTLLDDAVIDIGAWLGDEVSITFSEQEGDAFINGNGVHRPRGLATAPTVSDDAWAWGKVGFVKSGAAGDFAAANPTDKLIDLVYALKAGYRQNATFLMNRKTVSSLRKFKDGQGNYLWQPSAQAGQPATFLNYPIADDDYMPDVAANAFPIVFGDIRRAYLIVDRMGVRVLRDPYTKKGWVLFYTTKRVGGGIQDYQALKFLKISA